MRGATTEAHDEQTNTTHPHATWANTHALGKRAREQHTSASLTHDAQQMGVWAACPSKQVLCGRSTMGAQNNSAERSACGGCNHGMCGLRISAQSCNGNIARVSAMRLQPNAPWRADAVRRGGASMSPSRTHDGAHATTEASNLRMGRSSRQHKTTCDAIPDGQVQ